MKKFFTVLAAALLVTAVFISCSNTPKESVPSTSKTYKVGYPGPGGGTIIYDVDADNESGNNDGLKSSTCGWRYLEAAAKDADFNIYQTTFCFGYYRDSDNGTNQAVGTKSSTGLGAGQQNTRDILDKMGTNGYYGAETGSHDNNQCAASITKSINDNQTDGFGGMTDWYLPSRDEAVAMVTVLNLSGKYWTSTEGYTEEILQAVYADKRITSGKYTQGDKSSGYKVRPVRQFK